MTFQNSTLNTLMILIQTVQLKINIITQTIIIQKTTTQIMIIQTKTIQSIIIHVKTILTSVIQI